MKFDGTFARGVRIFERHSSSIHPNNKVKPLTAAFTSHSPLDGRLYLLTFQEQGTKNLHNNRKGILSVLFTIEQIFIYVCI